MNKGTLYLLPTPLAEGEMTDFITEGELKLISTLDCFVVEELRTARRFLSAAGLKGRIDSLELHELNEHSDDSQAEELCRLFDDGRDVGLLSEAGLPAVADPGAVLVALCHKKGIKVVPLPGPSSLMLALMGSGMNGQGFSFNGYLPAKTDERRKALQNLERISAKNAKSQLFIETPYRNDSMMEDIVQGLMPDTEVCIAVNLTAPDGFVITKTVEEWKREMPQIGKRPCVFILSASKECSSSHTTAAVRRKR